jgi:hypothetical protein
MEKERFLDTSDIGNQQTSSMRLRVAFLHWAGCLAAFILLVIIAASFSSTLFGYLAFFFYIGSGVYLNRSVLRKIVEWHPMYNTLYNVTSSKMKFFLFWPVTYLFLFMRLGINKIL